MLHFFRCIAGAGALLALSVFVGSAQAKTPTPSPIPTETPIPPTPTTMTLRVEGTTFRWDAVPGAATYHLTVNGRALRISMSNPFCGAPVVADHRSIDIDEVLDEAVISYSTDLPELPPGDAWNLYQWTAEISAIDEHSFAIGATRVGLIAETQCFDPQPLVLVGCTIPAGWYEVTTAAAREHRQRVFEASDGSERWYVFDDGHCIHLVGPVAPVPEFAPDTIVSTDDAGVLRPPNTGSSEIRSTQDHQFVMLILCIGVTMLGAGFSLRLRRSSRLS